MTITRTRSPNYRGSTDNRNSTTTLRSSSLNDNNKIYKTKASSEVEYIFKAKLAFQEQSQPYSVESNLINKKYTKLLPCTSKDCLNSDYCRTSTTITEDGRNKFEKEEEEEEEKEKTVELPIPKRWLISSYDIKIIDDFQYNYCITTGMYNMGNTCFINATLQALFHIQPLANWLLSDIQHRESCKRTFNHLQCIICCVSKTLLTTHFDTKYVEPFLVNSILNVLSDCFEKDREEDAHEFLRYLIQGMEESYLMRFDDSYMLDDYIRMTTPFNYIFGGYLRSTIQCNDCNNTSTTFQYFEDLSLDIETATNLMQSFGLYFAVENLHDMEYKCESCQKKVIAIKRVLIEKAPRVLCVQLKRFTLLEDKLHNTIFIPTYLDLTLYLSNKDTEPLRYRLVSSINHIGSSPRSGHYTAIYRHANGNCYLFDDCHVTTVNAQSILSNEAYLVFYELDTNISSTLIKDEEEYMKGFVHFNEIFNLNGTNETDLPISNTITAEDVQNSSQEYFNPSENLQISLQEYYNKAENPIRSLVLYDPSKITGYFIDTIVNKCISSSAENKTSKNILLQSRNEKTIDNFTSHQLPNTNRKYSNFITAGSTNFSSTTDASNRYEKSSEKNYTYETIERNKQYSRRYKDKFDDDIYRYSNDCSNNRRKYRYFKREAPSTITRPSSKYRQRYENIYN